VRPSLFIAASAAIIMLLGLIHLLYTFSGPRLQPREPELTARMQNVAPVISRETTMWRAWVGFNASHSFSFIFFAAIYGYLALRHSEFLFGSRFVLALGLIWLIGYVALATMYWFRAPVIGISLATVFYILGMILKR
jgi:hypothetical protein